MTECTCSWRITGSGGRAVVTTEHSERGLAVRRGLSPVSTGFVGAPECNGAIEHFIRTVMEQYLYLHRFRKLEEARRVFAAFLERCECEPLIGPLAYRTTQAPPESWKAPA